MSEASPLAGLVNPAYHRLTSGKVDLRKISIHYSNDSKAPCFFNALAYCFIKSTNSI
jgi:hypothetical protein